jgi:hypothetical protein
MPEEPTHPTRRRIAPKARLKYEFHLPNKWTVSLYRFINGRWQRCVFFQCETRQKAYQHADRLKHDFQPLEEEYDQLWQSREQVEKLAEQFTEATTPRPRRKPPQ